MYFISKSRSTGLPAVIFLNNMSVSHTYIVNLGFILLQIFYQVYTKMSDPIFAKVNTMLTDLNVTMSAKFILKVTWKNMAPDYQSKTTEVSSWIL